VADLDEASSDDIGTAIPDGHVSALAKVNALRPSIADFKGHSGFEYREEVDTKGNVTPHQSFVQNYGDGKGPTKAALAMIEAMRPFNRASAEFQGKTQANVSRETMVDAAGNRHQVEPHLAPEAARMNGWKPAKRIVGLLARSVQGDFCPKCDRLRSWCECTWRRHVD
jgi:hypothetical protein